MALCLIIEDTPKAHEAISILHLPWRKDKFQHKLWIGPYLTLKECKDIEALLRMDDIHIWKISPAS